MERVPRVVAVHDLSGFGRCSLTVALPVLSAMGVQVCPLPTAILSNHTGYARYFFEDFTEQMPAYTAEWQALGLSFEAIYTGFLGRTEQAELLLQLLEQFPVPLRLIDPVMADDGRLYSTCTPELVGQMKRLVARGTTVTPNLTEACLLTDTPYAPLAALSDEARLHAIREMGERLADMGPQQVVITGVHTADGRIHNVAVDRTRGERFTVSAPAVAKRYAGTGDVFASVLCGCLMRGETLRQAVTKTADYVGKVTAETGRRGLPLMDGIAFEPFLGELATL